MEDQTQELIKQNQPYQLYTKTETYSDTGPSKHKGILARIQEKEAKEKADQEEREKKALM